MSQVIKKHQKGGSLTIDGIKYDATPEFINALTTHLRDTAGTDAQTLAGLSNALQDGQDLRYDSAANTISGMYGDWSGITDRQNNLRGANSSRWRKWWEAQFDTDAHRFRNALSAIGSFHYQVPKVTEETPTNLKDIYGDTAWFDYIDKDGTKVWSENSAKNAGLMQRLDDMTAYLSDPEAGKKIYKLASQYTPEHMSALQGLYNQSKDRWADTLNQIKTRARNNQLDEDDIKFLNNFFIAKPNATPEEIAAAEEAAALAADKKRFVDAGFDYDKWSPYLTWNSDKNYWNVSGAGQEAFRSAFGGNGNYDFNDAFATSNYSNGYDFLNGYVVIGDRLYKASDAEDPNSDLAKWLSRKGGVRELNAAMRLIDANNQMEQLWGNTPDWSRGDTKHYMNWVNPNGNIFYRGVTGSYNWDKSNPNATQLAQFVEINPELADPFGRYTPQYMETDAYGNAFLNEDGTAVAYNGTPIKRENPDENAAFYRRELMYSDNPNSKFNGRYLVGDAEDENGNHTGLGFWIDPNNASSDWIVDANWNNYVSGMENTGIQLPPEMAQILSKYQGVMDGLQNNPVLRDKFIKMLATKVASNWNLITGEKSMTPNDWKLLGISDPSDIETLMRIVREKGAFKIFRGSKNSRRSEYAVIKPTLHKDGGKIEKHDIGQLLGKSDTNKSAPTQMKTDKPIRDIRRFHEIGSGDTQQKHDYLELMALIGDLASLGISLGTGWNPAGSIAAGLTGIGGSTAGFAADVRRDGFQGRDLLDYGINLGLDTLSFIPIVGNGPKVAKITKTLTKHRKLIKNLMTAAATAGIVTTGSMAYQKLENGENLNIRDIRSIVNAIGGATHLWRNGIKGLPKRGTGTVELPRVIPKQGKSVSEFEVPESAFSAIAKAKDKEGVAEILAKELNKSVAEGDTKWTKESIIDNFDLSKIVSSRKRFLLFGENKDKIKNLSEKMKKGKLDWDNRSVLGGEKAKQRSSDYNAILEGKQRIKTEVERPWNEVVPDRKNQYFVEDGEYFVNPSVERVVTEISPLQTKYRKLPGIRPITSGIVVSPYVEDHLGIATKNYNSEKPIKEAIAPSVATYGYQWRPVMQPVFKKGGKIEKGQSGLKFNGPILNPDFSSGFKFKTDPLYTVPTGSTTTFTPSSPTPLNSSTTSFKVANPMTGQPVQSTVKTTGTESIQGTESEGKQNPYIQGTFSEQKWNPDLNVPLNWARSLYAMKQSDKQLENFLNRPHYQMQGPILNAPRYINTGTGNAYRTQADNTRISKPVTSDAMQNDLMQRSRQQEARQLELQGALADSQEYGQYKAGLDEFTNNNILRNTDIANQNGQLRWQHELESIQAKNANIAEKSKFFDQAAYATQDWWNRNYQMLQGFEGSKAYTQKLRDMDDWYRQERLEIDKKNLDDNALAQELASLNTRLALKKQELGYDNLYWNMSPWFRRRVNKNIHIAKSGGKVSSDGKRSAVTYSRDPYPEVLLQNTKDSSQAVKQLNDAIIKLLLQTKPINVH